MANIDPKQFVLNSAGLVQEGLSLMLALDESHVDVKDVERIQKKLSLAANEMTKLRTWMVENLPEKPSEE